MAKPPYWNMANYKGRASFPKNVTLGPDYGTSFANRVFANGIYGLEMRPSWTSCVTQSIGSGHHIGIWSSPIELRGMVTFPKAVSPGS
jgi:hypothetical protein